MLTAIQREKLSSQPFTEKGLAVSNTERCRYQLSRVKQALSQPERKVELSAIQGNSLAVIYPRKKMQLSAIQGKEKAVS